MAALLADPAGFAVSFIVALLVAWKAVQVLEAGNRLMAIAVSAGAALVGPLVAGDLLAAQLVQFAGSSDNEAAVAALAPELFAFVSPMGFALIGAFGWSSFERR